MIQISELLAQVVEKPDEEHNPLKNWREKMAGQPLPEDPAKKNRDLKVPQIWTLSVLLTGEFIWPSGSSFHSPRTGHIQELIDSKERPKKFGLSLLSALAQRDVRTAEEAMEAGADMKLVDDKGDTAVILIVRGSVMSCVFVLYIYIYILHVHAAT